MKLKLTLHFQERMVERGINLDHVKQAVKNPDHSEPSYENSIKSQKKIDGRTIEVIYCKEAFKDKHDEYLMITAYYLD